MSARSALALTALIALLVLLPAASKAAQPAPIEGTWSEGQATINVVATGPGTYQGTLVAGSFGACPAGNPVGSVVWKYMQGSGLSYTGTIPWYRTDTCASVGDGATTFSLAGDSAGSFTTNSPIDGSSESYSFKRVGSPPGSTTNCTKGSKRVMCAGQKALLKSTRKQSKLAIKIGKQLRRAKLLKEQALKEKDKHKSGWEKLKTKATDITFDATIATYNLVTGKSKIQLPQIQVNLPKSAQEWKDSMVKGVTKAIDWKWGDTPLLKGFAFKQEADKTLSQINQMVTDADNYAATPAGQAELGPESITECGSAVFAACTPEQKMHIIAETKTYTNQDQKLVNHADDLGIAGAKFSLTVP